MKDGSAAEKSLELGPIRVHNGPHKAGCRRADGITERLRTMSSDRRAKDILEERKPVPGLGADPARCASTLFSVFSVLRGGFGFPM